MKEETGCSLPDAVIVKAWMSGETDAVFLFAALNVAPDDLSHSGFFLCFHGRTFLKNQAGAKSSVPYFRRMRK